MTFRLPPGYRSNPLFRPTEDIHLNACVGDNGGPYDFAAYGRGFFDGGFASIQAGRDWKAPVDVLVYPAAFSFRHGIELYIKHFLVELRKLGASKCDYKKNHKLQDNWKSLLKAASESEYEEFQPDQIATASKLIEHFCDIDPSGQIFRYPEDIKGNRHLTDIAIINLAVLEQGMQTLFRIFEDWEERIDVRWELFHERDC
jgi:uncharacterized protein YciU (UPF0263 family)